MVIALLRALWALPLLWFMAWDACGQSSAMTLDEGWQYRWGDSPFTAAGEPVWTRDAPDSEAWHSIGFPSNPPGRNGQTNVWFRVNLPENQWWEPILYIYSVDLITEVYLDSEKIYQYGTFDDQGKGDFAGWPWHMVPLPDDFDGKPLYFRVYSNYSDIGLWGEVKVNSRQDQVLRLLVNSADALAASAFSLLIAVLALFFALIDTQRRTFASVGLFSLSSALMVTAESPASLLLMYQPILWDYIAAGAYFMLPVAIGLLLEQWLPETRYNLIRRLWQGHLVYLAGALGLSLFGVIILPTAFYVFDFLLLASLTVLFILVIPNLRRVNREQQAIIATFALYAALLITDMAVAHGYLPWNQTPLSWGGLAFSLVISLISLRQYHYTRLELQALNQQLERRVDERTRKLESLADEERLRTRILSYEHEKSLLLNDMVTRLHASQTLVQAFDTLACDLPTYAHPLIGALYRRFDDDSELTLLARWGEHEVSPPEAWPKSRLPNKPTSADLDPMHQAKTEIDGQPYWTFPITVEDVDLGSDVLALLIIALPAEVAAGERRSGRGHLFQSIRQAMDKVGVVLSSLILRQRLETLSYEDSLTGLKNRRYFNELYAHESAIALRTRAALSFIMIDLDHFKGFNDRFGHQAGDEALRLVADTMRTRFRETDILCRYGGEEFIAILPGATSADAEALANEIRLAVHRVPIVHDNRNLGHLTLSAGIATWPEHCADPAQLLVLADSALYRAKEAGRNRVLMPAPSK
ncbi:MAG TPA: diguanylate cyclase [Saccharospirillum sp.]|nr:diguanylate cyclase [Saccharospirillum sp.]